MAAPPDPTPAWLGLALVGAAIALAGVAAGVVTFDPESGAVGELAWILVLAGAVVLGVAILGATPGADQ